jgi:hypothetical protein
MRNFLHGLDGMLKMKEMQMEHMGMGHHLADPEMMFSYNPLF